MFSDPKIRLALGYIGLLAAVAALGFFVPMMFGVQSVVTLVICSLASITVTIVIVFVVLVVLKFIWR